MIPLRKQQRAFLNAVSSQTSGLDATHNLIKWKYTAACSNLGVSTADNLRDNLEDLIFKVTYHLLKLSSELSHDVNIYYRLHCRERNP